jgi:hypothetical protein
MADDCNLNVEKIHTAVRDETNKEQNVATSDDGNPNVEKNPTEEQTSAAGDDAANKGNNGDAVRGEEQSVNDEDASISHLHSGKARPSTTHKQQPKLTVREFYRRGTEAAEAEHRKNTSKGGKINAVVARGRKRAPSKSVLSDSSSSSSDTVL